MNLQSNTMVASNDYEVLVVGGGQAGLGIGYYLKKSGLHFVILDAHEKTGDPWRERWDSLKLFTPRPFAALPGKKLSKRYSYYPTKDETAEYMEAYADEFALPIHHGCTVEKVTKQGDRFIVETTDTVYRAKQIVIATGPYNRPFIPDAATGLDTTVYQLHSSDYKNPAQIPRGDVLVVGGGNSGAQIAEDLHHTHSVTLATSGEPRFLPESIGGLSIYWLFYIFGLLRGRKRSVAAWYIDRKKEAVLGQNTEVLIRENKVQLIPYRVTGCEGTKVSFDDGSSRQVSSVIWTTGFKADYSWIDIDGVTNEEGTPLHQDGVSSIDGLYFMGLFRQSRLNSSIIDGIGADARHIATYIARTKS